MNEMEREALVQEANLLLDRIESTIRYIVESIKQKRQSA